jgi:uncharacterized protein (DUF736 family)
MSTQNNGALFPNNYKSKDVHPDYKGKITIDGVEKAIAGWVKTDKTGKEYLSISISELQERTENNNFEPNKLSPSPQKPSPMEGIPSESDDDLPF